MSNLDARFVEDTGEDSEELIISYPDPIEEIVLNDKSWYYGTLTEGESSQEVILSDEWEQLSDFETSESSGSDWM